MIHVLWRKCQAVQVNSLGMPLVASVPSHVHQSGTPRPTLPQILTQTFSKHPSTEDEDVQKINPWSRTDAGERQRKILPSLVHCHGLCCAVSTEAASNGFLSACNEDGQPPVMRSKSGSAGQKSRPCLAAKQRQRGAAVNFGVQDFLRRRKLPKRQGPRNHQSPEFRLVDPELGPGSSGPCKERTRHQSNTRRPALHLA
ncbi:predicted protein [Plenodomus lingam JN3]|uniref:Uncharacterized protein n=1 Tax=Leptosphaeria maculans (strain JN3 / isolate v23.1.3 / race Av1-4-5-6-7-8) TaxID=985895 RepID=M1ZIU4_LEPMJ|nr:predicted protein [Plenodomus lingam JN3]